MNFDATIGLADGRTLGYATYGAADGLPVVALHGSPDSRVIWRLANEAAHRVGVRLIAPDRPGFGISDPNPVALDEITVPTIIWQGGRDDVHTPAMARHLAAQIPDARLEFEPSFATFNFFDHLDDILTALAQPNATGPQ